MWSTFEKIMNAATFAEANEHDTALSLLTYKDENASAAKETVSQGVGLAETADQYMAAITFAEEGEHQYAREALDDAAAPACAPGNKCILVLGNEDTFADYLVDYAIDMAERFNYEIIAVNALPMSRKTRLLSGFADEIGQRFQNNATRAGSMFQDKAQERGVPFRQEIRLMSEQKAIRSLHNESGNIEFVLTEPENLGAESAPVCDGSVCVCSLVG